MTTVTKTTTGTDFSNDSGNGYVGADGFVTSYASGITAKAGGTKAAAVALTNQYNQISVCATANDSVLAPPAIPGRAAVIVNNGAANLAVYGAGTDTINGNTTATATVVAPGKTAILFCVAAGVYVGPVALA